MIMTQKNLAVIVLIILLGTVFAQSPIPRTGGTKDGTQNKQIQKKKAEAVAAKQSSPKQAVVKIEPRKPAAGKRTAAGPGILPVVLLITGLVLVSGQIALTLFFIMQYFDDRRNRKKRTEALTLDIVSRMSEKLGNIPKGQTLISCLDAIIFKRITDRLKLIQDPDGPAIMDVLKEIKQKQRNSQNSNLTDNLQSLLNDFNSAIREFSNVTDAKVASLTRCLSDLESNSSAFSHDVETSSSNLQQLVQSVQDAQLLRDLGQIKQIITDAVNEIGDRKDLEAECRNAKAEVEMLKADAVRAAAAIAERDDLQKRIDTLQQDNDRLESDYRQLTESSQQQIAAMEKASQEKCRRADEQIATMRKETADLQNKYKCYGVMEQQFIPGFMKDNSSLAGFFDDLKKQAFDERFSAEAFQFHHALALVSPAIKPESPFNTETWMLFKILGRSLNAFLRVTGKSEAEIVDMMKCFSAAVNDALPMIKLANGTMGKAFTIIVPDLGQSINVVTTIHTANGTTANKILNWGIIDARGNCQLKAEVA